MKAAFVNQLSHAGVPYADLLVGGQKTIESRSRNMLSALVGERIAIVKTIKGKKPMVVGYVNIVRSSFCKAENFDKFFNQHFVPPGSAYDVKGRGKWFYFVENAERCEPFPLPAYAVRHGRSWCEF